MQRKADMKANSQLAPTLRPDRRHGHIPGIAIGDHFHGKGELAIMGIHTNINSGIDYK